MKKEYWVLYDGKELIKEHEEDFKLGSIHAGFCAQGICGVDGCYIVFDDNYKNYKKELLMYLILREDTLTKNIH